VSADLGDGPVLGIAEAADEGDDIESELVVRQCKGAFGFGTIGPLVCLAGGEVAATNGEIKPSDTGERVEGPVVGIVGPKMAATVQASRPLGCQVVSDGRFKCLRRLGHGSPSWC
jgi:hypothetical protein